VKAFRLARSELRRNMVGIMVTIAPVEAIHAKALIFLPTHFEELKSVLRATGGAYVRKRSMMNRARNRL